MSRDGATGAADLQQIGATTEHPFWVEGKGWVAACQLHAGDLLKRIDSGACLRVVSAELSGTKADVFNFEVEGVHNYFVGRDGVLVHNESRQQSSGFRPGVTYVEADGLQTISATTLERMRADAVSILPSYPDGHPKAEMPINNNCSGNCVAVDAIRAGHGYGDAVALSNRDGMGAPSFHSDPVSDVPNQLLVYEALFHESNGGAIWQRGLTDPSGAAAAVQGWGEGARGIVFAGNQSGGGHFYNVEVVAGVAVPLDGTRGTVGIWTDGGGGLAVLRTTNVGGGAEVLVHSSSGDGRAVRGNFAQFDRETPGLLVDAAVDKEASLSKDSKPDIPAQVGFRRGVYSVDGKQYAWDRSALGVFETLIGRPGLDIDAPTGPSPDMALGLSHTTYLGFPSLTNSWAHPNWGRLEGFSPLNEIFVSVSDIPAVMRHHVDRGGLIHFNLSQMDGLRTVQSRSNLMVTEVELTTILRSPKLYGSTIFYVNGDIQSESQLTGMGLKPPEVVNQFFRSLPGISGLTNGIPPVSK